MKIKLLFITLLLSTLGFAQSKGTISGVITDKDLNNETLPFATVTVKGTTNAAQTDIDGKYALEVNPGTYVLVYGFLGYESQEERITIAAGEKKTINKVADNAPENASTEVSMPPITPKALAIVIASPAPEFTPRMLGVARRL